MLGCVLLLALSAQKNHLVKYIPNLKALYEDGKILEAEQKLQEMKLERLNIED